MTQALLSEALVLPDHLKEVEERLLILTRAALRAKERLRDREACLTLDESVVNGRTEAIRAAQVRALTCEDRAKLDLAEEARDKAAVEFRHLERRWQTLLALASAERLRGEPNP